MDGTKNNTLDLEFDGLIEKASLWFVERYIKISLSGTPLTKKQLVIASKVGVKSPDRIRILSLPEYNFHKDYSFCHLSAFETLPLINFNRSQSVIYKYGLVMQNNAHMSNGELAELFRFISFYEGFGSIKIFLSLYLRSVYNFGWEKNPFNADAKLTGMTYQ
ncbi:MAG: hypothetical protein JJV97_06005 [SAR324 cluster bacterium]|nr:hypothetical protein [SAR324 cluster bacterium]